MNKHFTRRDFFHRVAGATGTLVLAPYLVGCEPTSTPDRAPTAMPILEPVAPTETPAAEPPSVPLERPAGWDALAFNKRRGNAGAIPASYLDDINGPDGDARHLGKHLPFLPALDPGVVVPAGMLAIMWGDPSKGYARHPNAASTEGNPEGHWYNWIRLRKATAGDTREVESHYRSWPAVEPGDDGAYTALAGDDPARDGGENTVYLAQLPPDVVPGDLVRVHAHCLTHGEYVDFVQLPG
ncbi:MAG: hypothetical protein IPI43_18535 [Sandaracinaceae bacterium]|nr:hypothetical protein [Sandaracinaceae bacterium]MBK7776100.1 hypothetical protein [Sandaracinaceae bacterium]